MLNSKKAPLVLITLFVVGSLGLLAFSSAANSVISGINPSSQELDRSDAEADGGSYIEFKKDEIVVSGDGVISDPYSFKVIPGFDPSKNLLNSDSVSLYEDWWSFYNDPDNYYQDSPELIFAAGDLGNSNSNGSYSYTRTGGSYLASIVDMIRVTGDPEALEELVFWSKKLKLNLKDHDGRGYEFFEYMNGQFGSGYDQDYNPKYEYSDTNFLDEQMLAGTIALIAHALHENRDYSTEAGVQADIWFDYLANNWTPKWLARTTIAEDEPYKPQATLGLENAVDWDHPRNPKHDDTHPTFSPLDEDWTPAYDDKSGPDHLFPVRHFGHPYMMSLFQYWALADYFDDGTGSVSSEAFNPSMFEQEAQTRHDWWYQQTTKNSDGSRDWWLLMRSSGAGLRVRQYSRHVVDFANALHYVQFGEFAKDSRMEEYAKAYYNGSSAGDTDVFNKGDTVTMRNNADGSGGNVKFTMRSAALLGCWDDTGEILSLTRKAINSPSSHSINGSTRWSSGIHYSAQLSCIIKDAQ